MTRLPNPPSPGDKISVSFYRQLWQYLRETRMIAGNGISLSRGVGGTVINCKITESKNTATQEVKAAEDLGPFIPTYENGVMSGIGDGFLQTAKGTVAVAGEDFPISGLITDSGTPSAPTYSGIVAIKVQIDDDSDSSSDSASSSDTIGVPQLVGYANLSAMQAEQTSLARTYAIIPVYQLKKSKVTLDFRLLSYAVVNSGGMGDEYVRSLNELTGELKVIGGEKIKITPIADKGYVKVEFDENKDTDDENPYPPDPCAHPGNPGEQAGSGVAEPFSGIDKGGGIYAGAGGDQGIQGVPANGDAHLGDNNCNCE